jgi:hypothetical protein
VLEYRVWCHPERGAEDLEDSDDYSHSFATYSEAQEFSLRTKGHDRGRGSPFVVGDGGEECSQSSKASSGLCWNPRSSSSSRAGWNGGPRAGGTNGVISRWSRIVDVDRDRRLHDRRHPDGHVLISGADEKLIEPRAHVRAYRERCKARPAWQRTLERYCERVEAA